MNNPKDQGWTIIDPHPAGGCSEYSAVCEGCRDAGGDGKLYASMVWRNDQTGQQLCDYHLKSESCTNCGMIEILPEGADPTVQLCLNCLCSPGFQHIVLALDEGRQSGDATT